MRRRLYTIPESPITTMSADDLLRLDAVAEFADNAICLVDTWERGHGARTAGLVETLAQEMNIDTADIVLLKYLAHLHDLGKLAIPDNILHRRKFSVSNMDTMKGHPLNGYNLIKDMRFDDRIGIAIWEHHEKWDGTGYPRGLKGFEISLWGRIISVVDSWDAITSDRSDRKARTITAALKEMEMDNGTKFDPDIYAAFRRTMVGHE